MGCLAVQDTWEYECSAIQETGELGCLAVQDEWEDECSVVKEWEFSAARDERTGMFRSLARVGAGVACRQACPQSSACRAHKVSRATEQSHLNGSKGMLRCQNKFIPVSSLCEING